MRILPFNAESIRAIRPGEIGYIGKMGYDAMIRVFEREANYGEESTEFRHRCWFGSAIFYGDAKAIIVKAEADGVNSANGVIIILDDDEYPGPEYERLAEVIGFRYLRIS